MIKPILIICFGVMMTCGFSQTLSLRFGPANSNLTWDNSVVAGNVFDKNITGFDILLGLDYLDHRYFNLSTNLGFIQKGGSGSALNASLPDPEAYSETSIVTRLNYITVNTTFEAKLPVKDILTPFVHVGPRVDYMVSYAQNVNLFSQFTELDQLNKIIYGVVGGAGVDFKINRFKVGIVFDYYRNFNKLVDYTSSRGVSNQIYDHTFTLNAQVGYKF